MYDIVFVDIPYVNSPTVDALSVEMVQYANECISIAEHVAKIEVKEYSLYYTAGILYLSAYLKEHIQNISVGYIHNDINMPSFDLIVMDTKVLAFSTMTFSMTLILTLAQKAKQINPDISVIVGGYHASYCANQILEENEFIDLVLIKEGERSLLQYMQGTELDKISGIAYRDASGYVHITNDPTVLLPAEIPIPDYSLIQNHISLFNICISTMRGCVGKCKFCVNGNYWGMPRLIPLNKVIDELLILKRMVEPGRIIHINDNVFTYQPSRLKILYELMEQNNLLGYFRFECDTLSSFISESIVHQLKKIGVYKICLGFEDCDNGVLSISGKPVTFQDNINAAIIIKKTEPEICVYAYWLFGLPGSTTDSMDKNLEAMHYLITHDIVDIVSPKVFIPYPGTIFFEHHAKYGLTSLSFDWDLYERRNPPYPYLYETISHELIFKYLIKGFQTCHAAYRRKWGDFQ